MDPYSAPGPNPAPLSAARSFLRRSEGGAADRENRASLKGRSPSFEGQILTVIRQSDPVDSEHGWSKLDGKKTRLLLFAAAAAGLTAVLLLLLL